MRTFTTTLVAGAILGAAAVASAQTDPAALSRPDIEAACGAAPLTSGDHHSLRVIGVQDVVGRTSFDNRDLLVINGGTTAGVQLGAEFFVRRASQYMHMPSYGEPVAVTDGWIRIVSVNETTAIAKVDHVCGGMFVDDYLEPFAAPSLPANADAAPTGELDFSSTARVVAGSVDHLTSVPGEFVTIDRGSESGVAAGTRFAVYRDLTHNRPMTAAEAGVPLMAVGEAVVVSASGSRAVVKIVRARDAVLVGDYAVLRR